jgi:hypothetical protein
MTALTNYSKFQTQETRPRPYRTSAASDDTLSTSASSRRLAKWVDVFSKLDGWALSPNLATDDDDIPAPTAVSIKSAIGIAQLLCEQGKQAPMRVVPSVSAGIVLEWKETFGYATVEIEPDGQAEVILFAEGRIKSRSTIAVA